MLGLALATGSAAEVSAAEYVVTKVALSTHQDSATRFCKKKKIIFLQSQKLLLCIINMINNIPGNHLASVLT